MSIQLTATRQGPDVVLTWTDDTHFGTYSIFRAGPESGTYILLTMVQTLQYVDRDVPDKMMSYFITAERSNTVNVPASSPVPPDPTPPPGETVIASNVAAINVVKELTEYEGVMAEVGVVSGESSVIFHSGQETRAFPLHQGDVADATIAWVRDFECWAWSKSTAYQILLDRVGVPTSITVTKTKVFGDSESRNGPIIALSNGGILGSWWQHTPPQGTQDMIVGFAYRDAAWQWHTTVAVVPSAGGGNIMAANLALCQHPVDGRIWAFLKRDGYSWLAAVSLSVASGTPVIDNVFPKFIDQAVHGPNGPEGELPDMRALPGERSIVFAYQCNVFKIFSTTPVFIKGAHVAVAKITASGSLQFLPRLEQWVSRAAPMSMSLVGDDVVLGYRLIHDETQPQPIAWSRLSGSTWSAPAPIGTWSRPQAALANAATFWLVEQNGDLRQVTP